MSRKLESSPARREVSSKAAPKATAARGADLSVDLVAHHDLDAEALALVRGSAASTVNPVRAVLMLMPLAAPPSSSRVTSPGRGGALVGDDRDRAVLDQPAAAEHVVGRAQLLGEACRSRSAIAPQRAGRLGGGPAAVAVDVELDVGAERLAQRAAGGDVERRSGRRPTFTLNVVIPYGVADALGLGDHLGGLARSRACARPASGR